MRRTKETSMHRTTRIGLLSMPLAAIAMTGAAHAVVVLGNGDSISMASIFAAGSDRKVMIDDKIFTFESLRSSAFSASQFQVIGFISASTNQWGLHDVGFDITGPFGDGMPGDGAYHEMNLQYTVEVAPEFYARDVRLCDVGLVFNGSAGGPGSIASVDETVWDLDANRFLGNLRAYDYAGDEQETQLTDYADYCELYDVHGFRAFEVNKDIKFFANTPNSFATASFVRQEFSQIMAPAPGAIALLAAVGMISTRRRR
jgi:hypothetical protein